MLYHFQPQVGISPHARTLPFVHTGILIRLLTKVKMNSFGQQTVSIAKSMSFHSGRATPPKTTVYHPPRQNAILEWCRNMFSARHLLSNRRQKRVIHHRVQRTSSHQTETEHKSFWSPYVYPGLLTILVITLPTKYATPIVMAIAMFKRIVLHIFSVMSEHWFQNDQRPGPTYRERLYYYVDYWISTNPYVS